MKKKKPRGATRGKSSNQHSHRERTTPVNTTTATTRKNAAQDRRIICRNFRQTARRLGVRPIDLMTAARVKPLRMLRVWTGQQIFLPDMFRIAAALGMTVDDMFAGTHAKGSR